MEHHKALGNQRQRRVYRVRKRLKGTAARPRLSVHRSHRHIAAQVIDDARGATLAAASSVEKDLAAEVGYGGNKAAAEAVGRVLAARAAAAGVKQVCFDRGAAKYHGRVAALAEAARAGGLDF
jgi:large subunit ribosomal protein L18